MNASQLINQSSGSVKLYTPEFILTAARRTLYGIDLDPASSELANKAVRATLYYTEPNRDEIGRIDGLPVYRYHDWGGLKHSWGGNVWMNHPFGSAERACSPGCIKKRCIARGYHTATDLPGNADWINKLDFSYREGSVSAACCLTFASTSEKWFQPLLKRPQCFLYPRTNYLLPDGSVHAGVPKGSVVTYFGIHIKNFYEHFNQLGTIHTPYKP